MRDCQHIICTGFWMHGYIGRKLQKRVGEWSASCQVLDYHWSHRRVSHGEIVYEDHTYFFVHLAPVGFLINKGSISNQDSSKHIALKETALLNSRVQFPAKPQLLQFAVKRQNTQIAAMHPQNAAIHPGRASAKQLCCRYQTTFNVKLCENCNWNSILTNSISFSRRTWTIFSLSNTGILGQRKSEFSQLSRSKLRPSDY